MSVSLTFLLLMAKGYLITVLCEGAVLFAGLRYLSHAQRLFLSFWLTAITYPFVWLVFSLFFDSSSERFAYLLAAEVFAPLAECLAFKFSLGRDLSWRSARLWFSFAVITAANLVSFGVGILVPWWSG